VSSIFGIHDGSRAMANGHRRELLQRMGDRAKQTMAGFERQLEFAVQHGDGIDLGLCGPRSQQGGPSPSVFRQGHLWLAFGGRLDPCAELDRSLGLVRTDRSAMAGALDQQQEDAKVVAVAYGRFGIDCVDRLHGDWAFALWDDHERRLLLARDATGLSSLYWYSQRGQLLFASSIPVLMASGAVPTRPDPRWMAGLLATFVDTRYPTGTAFQGLHALPAGHLLLVQGGKEELRRWWRPRALTPLWREDLPQLQERFLKVYQDAVFAALPPGQGKTVATLSGGLDSGSVVALAAPMLLQRGQRLTAFVHRPMFDGSSDYPDRETDEWSSAFATAQHVGNVDAVSCPSEKPSPIEAIRQWLDMTVVPSHPVANWFWLLDVARRAALDKADVLLNGQAGNFAVSYVGNGSLWPRVMHFQLTRVWAELQAERAGVFSAIGTRLVKPPLRPVWHRVKKSLASPEATPPWNAYSLIHPGLAMDVGLRAAMRADDHDPSFTSMSAAKLALFRLTELGGVDNGGSLWSELGRSHGFVVRDPTRDRNLIELCWRLPDELFWAQGLRRGLVRNGMCSQLPAQVLFSSRRGQQAADLKQRLQFCGAEVLAEAERLTHHPIVRQWIDTKRLMECASLVLERKDDATRNNAYWPQHFLRTLGAAEFISRYA
jgi:asparagine synthase (glutamine-hydrolysing)